MSRNYGLGQRDMGKAGEVALQNSAKAGEVSFSTAGTNAERWNTFTTWAKDEGVKKMENITPELVTQYGQELAERVASGSMAAATAQNYVSAVNSVMSIAAKGDWKSVSPTRDCEIAQRSAVRQDAPGALDLAAYSHAVEAVRAEVGERAGAVVELARELGLRSKEASLLDARRELVQATMGGGLHDLRAAYACERYKALTGHAAPCAGGEIRDRERDAAARLAVAKELGHGRAEVAAEYLGARS